jgi:hypothetical protein
MRDIQVLEVNFFDILYTNKEFIGWKMNAIMAKGHGFKGK